MVFGVYRNNHPATAVDHCCHCYFINSNEPNLIIAGGSYLRIFRYVPMQEDDQIKHRLEQVLSYNLFGVINSMVVAKYPGNKRHSLLLAVGEAQLSVVDYDPAMHTLKTKMLYNYEQDDQRTMFLQQTFLPQVRVDPENRAAAMLIYGSRLVVVPLLKSSKSSTEPCHQRYTPVHQNRIIIRNDISGNDLDLLSSYVVDLKSLDERVNNVKDFQFLHGYCEPTIVLLYEPLRTWPGRVAVRKDTCSIVAIALNIRDKVHPSIWSQNNLPFDSLYVLPVPKPTAGVLVFAVNSLLYLNQAIPPFGMLLNSLAEYTTDFPVQKSTGIMLTLDDSQAVMMEDERVFVSLKSGDIYLITLISDGMRSIKRFNWYKAASSVLTSCICMATGNYIFLGSRFGNSILLHYQEKSSVTADILEPIEQTTKRQKVTGEEDLDLEIFGNRKSKPDIRLSVYEFEVCDSLINFSPITQMTVGEAPYLSEEYKSDNHLDLEIVACSGYGKNGALSIFQNSIRPLVNSTFDLPTVYNMWTIYSNNNPFHSFLILAKSDSTLILHTGEDIAEVEESDFITDETTVHVSNIQGFILQVCARSLLLLKDVTLVDKAELPETVQGVSVSDPYGAVLFKSGLVYFLTVENNKINLTDTSASGVVCLTTYMDNSGIFTTEPRANFSDSATTGNTESEMTGNGKTEEDIDEDMLLYGDTNEIFEHFKKQAANEKLKEPGPPMITQLHRPTHWCILSREDGAMEIRSLPSWELLYFCRNFALSPKVLMNADDHSTIGNEGIPHVKEICVTGLGWRGQRPHLVTLIDDDLHIYTAFPYNSEGKSDLKVRFSKIQHEVLIKKRKSRSNKLIDIDAHPFYTPKIQCFSNISGYSGIFLVDDNPQWLFLTTHGALRAHPMYIDGKVTCFAPFHNDNCHYGFLYFSNGDELRICNLPSTLTYDNHWPAKKVNLRATPHFVAYHHDTKTYAVCTSSSSLNPMMPKMQNNLDKEEVPIEEDDVFPYPSLDWYSITLYTRDGWEVIPNSRIDLPKYEKVTCMKYMQLSGEQMGEQMKGYIVAGTMCTMGEEVSARGKIVIFDVMEVVPDPEKPLSGFKFKCLYDKEQKGPVTDVDCIMGHIVSAIGQKLYVWSFVNNELVGVAFIDTLIYIHSISVIKNFILYADITKSISLLTFDKECKTLSVVSRDFEPMEVYRCEFVVDGQNLCFMVSDSNCNLVIYSYQPDAVESSGGQKLIRKSDICIGGHVNTFFRTGIRIQDGSILGTTPASALLHPSEKRHVTWCATLDGAISSFLPLSEKRYRRLFMLHNKLVTAVPHIAGLNPKKFRTAKMPGRWLMNPHRNILDYQLLTNFLTLSHTERRELAKQIGTTPAQILDDLMNIQKAMLIF